MRRLFKIQPLFARNSKLFSHSKRFITISNNEKEIQSTLTQQIQPSFMRIFDVSGGCGESFEIYIVSEKFEGQTPIKQHRMVMDPIKPLLKGIHAVRLHTKTPVQFEKDKESGFISEDV